MKHIKKNEFYILAILCIVFFVSGIMVMIVWRKNNVTEWDYLSQEHLYGLINMQWDKRALFFQCIYRRAVIVIILLVAAASGIGMWALRITVSWFAVSLGILMEAAVLQYGLLGIPLFVAGIFPQYYFYLSAYFLLCKSYIRFYEKRRVYPVNRYAGRTDKNVHLIIQNMFLIGVVIIGCALESYVNPIILKLFLKNFI